MDERLKNNVMMMQLCKAIFNANVIGTDFDDAKVLVVSGRKFHQHPGGHGLNISFSVSGHALEKCGPKAAEAINHFVPDEGTETNT